MALRQLPGRRELCHMLHAQRKAEIQILCQAAPTMTPELATQNVNDGSYMASSDKDDGMATGTSRSCPIVAYLEGKMNNSKIE